MDVGTHGARSTQAPHTRSRHRHRSRRRSRCVRAYAIRTSHRGRIGAEQRRVRGRRDKQWSSCRREGCARSVERARTGNRVRQGFAAAATGRRTIAISLEVPSRCALRLIDTETLGTAGGLMPSPRRGNVCAAKRARSRCSDGRVPDECAASTVGDQRERRQTRHSSPPRADPFGGQRVQRRGIGDGRARRRHDRQQAMRKLGGAVARRSSRASPRATSPRVKPRPVLRQQERRCRRRRPKPHAGDRCAARCLARGVRRMSCNSIYFRRPPPPCLGMVAARQWA